MSTLKLSFSSPSIDANLSYKAVEALHTLRNRKDSIGSYCGWIGLPYESLQTLSHIETIASRLRSLCEAVVCIGIGGSYLGGKSIIEALQEPFASEAFPIYYAGQHLDNDYLAALIEHLREVSFGIVYISKSGSTLEPAIAFSQLRHLLEDNLGKEAARERIVTITDPHKGLLYDMAEQERYTRLVIPTEVGGRYSILSAVGLLPILLAGMDAKSLLHGAQEAYQHYIGSELDVSMPLIQYVAWRLSHYHGGKKIELFATYVPQLYMLQQWWRQLFAETEGKESKGIYPSIATFTTDLHSIGQWIQQGDPILMETILSIEAPQKTLSIVSHPHNQDGLRYLQGKTLHWVNSQAEEGVYLAHQEGRVPLCRIVLSQLDAHSLGYLYFFFELAAAMSALLQGVNPFDQPGVESYKSHMYQLIKQS